jgi:hypothetical protein
MESALILISFDIDGTLETGDPPGPIDIAFVRKVKEQGCLIGSCSDRTVTEQLAMWALAGIQVDFAVVKHQLQQVRSAYPCGRYIHIGDTQTDADYAGKAEFDFFFVLDLADHLRTGDGHSTWMQMPPGRVGYRTITGREGQ